MHDDDSKINIVDDAIVADNIEEHVSNGDAVEANKLTQSKKPINKRVVVIVVLVVVVVLVGALSYTLLLNGWLNPNSGSSDRGDKTDKVTAESLVINDKDDLETAKKILNRTVTKPSEEAEELQDQK